MPVELTATDTSPLIVFNLPSGVYFESLSSNGAVTAPPVQVTPQAAGWVSGEMLAGGGFRIVWDSPTSGLMEQDYNASGQPVGGPQPLATPPSPAPDAFTSDDSGASTILLDGSLITLTQQSNANQGFDLVATRTAPNGAPEGSAILASQGFHQSIDLATATPLANGAYVAAWVVDSPVMSEIDYRVGSADGVSGTSGTLVDYQPVSGQPMFRVDSLAVAGLPDGAFVVAWTAFPSSAMGGEALEVREVGPGGASFSTTVAALDAAGLTQKPRIVVQSDGSFTVSWADSSGAHVKSFTEAQANLGATNDTVLTPDTNYVLPDGPHALFLTGTGAQVVTGNNLGDVITENNAASTITGGFGADTIVAGTGGGKLTGGAGADVFAFKAIPNTAPEVTDFTPGVDKLDFTVLLAGAGYTGSDPIGAGYVKLIDNGQGGTWIYFDAHPASDPNGSFVVTVDGVKPGQLSDNDFVGGSNPSPGSPGGNTSGGGEGEMLQAQNGGSQLTGGAGDDILIGASGPDVMTGAAGHDRFTFNVLPQASGQITDFTPGTDKIDFGFLLEKAGYTGSNPLADGFVRLVDDGHGGTQVFFDATPATDPTGTLVTDLSGVAPSQVSAADIAMGAASAQDAIQIGFDEVLRQPTPTSADQAFRDSLMSQANSGSLTTAQAAADIVQHAEATTSVATLAYQFFTGSAPSAQGMDYLVNPTGPNANNLNSAYYQSFALENRYINFAVNLGSGAGAGASGFASLYGSGDIYAAVHQAYKTIFGIDPTDAKVHQIIDSQVTSGGQTMTRGEYFALYGGDGVNGIGTKAAMAGWLMAEGVKADVGDYAKSNDAFLTDVALHDAPFGVNLIGHYDQPGFALTGG